MKECPPEDSQARAGRAGRKRDRVDISRSNSTRPMTLGYGLNDSPAGLAAWIVEKFRAWSDSGGDAEKKFTKDELLTNITIYWATQSGPSSVRLYFENRVDSGLTGRVEVPFACARFPREMFAIVPTKWIEAQYNLQQLTEQAARRPFRSNGGTTTPRRGRPGSLPRPPLTLLEDLFETTAKAVDHQTQVEHIVQGAQRRR